MYSNLLTIPKKNSNLKVTDVLKFPWDNEFEETPEIATPEQIEASKKRWEQLDKSKKQN